MASFWSSNVKAAWLRSVYPRRSWRGGSCSAAAGFSTPVMQSRWRWAVANFPPFSARSGQLLSLAASAGEWFWCTIWKADTPLRSSSWRQTSNLRPCAGSRQLRPHMQETVASGRADVAACDLQLVPWGVTCSSGKVCKVTQREARGGPGSEHPQHHPKR